MMRRRLVLPLVPVVLLGLYVGYWFVGAAMMRGEIDRLIESQRAQGIEVEVESLEVGGFPFSFEAQAVDFVVRAPDGGGWRGGGVRAGAATWNWSEVAFDLADHLTVTLPGSPPATLTVTEGSGTVRLGGPTRIRDGNAAFSDLVLLMEGTDAITADTVTVSMAPPEEAADGRSRHRAIAEMNAIALPQALAAMVGAAGLDRPVDRVAVDLAIAEPVPRQPRAAELAAWRDGGGDVIVNRLSILWGALEIEAGGRLGLDQQLQPEGTLTARVRGADRLVDALIQAGVLDQGNAGFIRAGMAMLSGAPGTPDAGVITAPLRIADGAVSFGPWRVVDLPVLQWPS